MKEIEKKIVVYFNQMGGKKIDIFLAFINSIRFLAFFWIVLIILAIIKNPEIAKHFLEAVIIAALLHFIITEGILKHLLIHIVTKRRRPYVQYPELIKPIGKKFSDSSFPSSHMTTTAAMFFVITSFYPSLIVLAIMAILLMAFSRLYNGMHYLSDIIAGVLLGMLYGYIAINFIQ